MDTRVLKYFLTIAKTGNVTKAAKELHITQPTLSRQISDLEKQLNITLFDRTNRHLHLTKAGAFFQKRAQMILDLVAQTENDIQTQESELVGTIRIGCVESSASNWLMKIIKKMHQAFPNIHFDIYTANGDDLKEKLDQNLLDLALLLEPIEAKKYNYIRLPIRDTWGVIAAKNDYLSKKELISTNDLYQIPLTLSARSLIRNELAQSLKININNLNIIATHNLASNPLQLVKQHITYLLGIDGLLKLHHDPDLTFIPFTPKTTTGHIIAWRKNTYLSPLTEKFLQLITENLNQEQTKKGSPTS